MEDMDHNTLQTVYQNGIMNLYFPDHTQEEAEEYADKIESLVKEYLSITVEIDF